MTNHGTIKQHTVRAASDYEVQEIAAALKEGRLRCGYSVKKVAELMGFASVQAVYKHENGTSVPSGDVLWAYMNLYSINPSEVRYRNIQRGIVNR